jgi:hypothetical protein
MGRKYRSDEVGEPIPQKWVWQLTAIFGAALVVLFKLFFYFTHLLLHFGT